MDTLDVKQMKLLLALLEEKNLTRVANKLSVSQQAVSEQLKKLRMTFSDRLFVRAKHGVVPTPFAENLGVVVRDVLEKLEQARRQDTFSLTNVSQTFVISASDYAQKVLLIDLLKIIRPQAPGLKVIIKDLETDNIERALLEGSVNLVISAPNGLPSSLPSTRLMSESFTCVVAASTPESAAPTCIEDLANCQHLIVSPSRAALKGSADSWFSEHGINRQISVSVPSFELAPEFIEAYGAVAFLPTRLLPDERLRPIKLETLPPGFELRAAWHHRCSQDPLHQWIVNELMQIAQSKEASEK